MSKGVIATGKHAWTPSQDLGDVDGQGDFEQLDILIDFQKIAHKTWKIMLNETTPNIKLLYIVQVEK